jgi:calcium-binding protein CML
MSRTSFLDFQYNLSKRKYLRKPSRLFSKDKQNSGVTMFSKNRQNSGLKYIFQPSLDEMKMVFENISTGVQSYPEISRHGEIGE